MVQASEISASQSESIDTLVSQTTALVDSGRWKLCNDGKGLERQFKFKTFRATWVSLPYLYRAPMPAADSYTRTL